MEMVKVANRIFESISEAVGFLSPSGSVESIIPYGSGGCINKTSKIILQNKTVFFLKENNNSPDDMFSKEAFGLEILSRHFPYKVPRSLAVGKEKNTNFLILEFIPQGSPSEHFWSTFGRALAIMHKVEESDSFGFREDNYIGSTKQNNECAGKWSQFFAEKRLIYQVEIARLKGYADKSISDGIENICKRIDSLITEPDHASLLHGDLWSGNFLIGKDGNTVLIDPAVYYGNREADIAMTELFGGFNNSFYRGYNEEYPLEKGYKNRRNLLNLYHMLNHLNIFGSSYSGTVKSIISEYL